MVWLGFVFCVKLINSVIILNLLFCDSNFVFWVVFVPGFLWNFIPFGWLEVKILFKFVTIFWVISWCFFFIFGSVRGGIGKFRLGMGRESNIFAIHSYPRDEILKWFNYIKLFEIWRRANNKIKSISFPNLCQVFDLFHLNLLKLEAHLSLPFSCYSVTINWFWTLYMVFPLCEIFFDALDAYEFLQGNPVKILSGGSLS